MITGEGGEERMRRMSRGRVPQFPLSTALWQKRVQEDGNYIQTRHQFKRLRDWNVSLDIVIYRYLYICTCIWVPFHLSLLFSLSLSFTPLVIFPAWKRGGGWEGKGKHSSFHLALPSVHQPPQQKASLHLPSAFQAKLHIVLVRMPTPFPKSHNHVREGGRRRRFFFPCRRKSSSSLLCVNGVR